MEVMSVQQHAKDGKCTNEPTQHGNIGDFPSSNEPAISQAIVNEGCEEEDSIADLRGVIGMGVEEQVLLQILASSPTHSHLFYPTSMFDPDSRSHLSYPYKKRGSRN